jgi:hypothetical protein
VNFWHRQTGWMRWAGFFCVVTLVLATTVQAAHFCGFPRLDARNAAHARGASRPNSLCLTCLMAQAAAAASLFIISALAPPSSPLDVSARAAASRTLGFLPALCPSSSGLLGPCSLGIAPFRDGA